LVRNVHGVAFGEARGKEAECREPPNVRIWCANLAQDSTDVRVPFVNSRYVTHDIAIVANVPVQDFDTLRPQRHEARDWRPSLLPLIEDCLSLGREDNPERECCDDVERLRWPSSGSARISDELELWFKISGDH
jgi:hypothetical protein